MALHLSSEIAAHNGPMYEISDSSNYDRWYTVSLSASRPAHIVNAKGRKIKNTGRLGTEILDFLGHRTEGFAR